jgi:transposase
VLWKQGVMSGPNPHCPGCVALLAQIAALAAQVTQLQAQVTQLQARLNQNSRNSSRPPSADGPQHRPPPPKPPPSGRRPGGQPGHPSHPRPLKPESEVDCLVPVVPVICAHCQAVLPPAAALADPPPQRHQVIDLPAKLLETTEYQLHARTCAACGKRTWAALPPEAPAGVVGPGLQALCALLVGHFHLSRRDTQALLAEVLGENLSLGALSALEGRTAQALEAPYAAVQAAVAAAPAVNADETSWREGKQKAWLWTATTPALSLFRIDRCRSRAAFEQLLPPVAPGVRTVTSDRYSAYRHLRGDEHQLCWSHLIRDFTALAELKEGGQATGEGALAVAAELFTHWHAFRAGAIDRATLQQRLRPPQARLCRLLRRARDSGHWKGAGLARDLLRQWPSLWTFARVAGVEPTNNAAERAVRPGVLWRKRSFGNQGASGRAFVERLLTVAGSLRLQGRSVFAYLQAAVRAGRAGGTAPSLLPEEAGAGQMLPLAA